MVLPPEAIHYLKHKPVYDSDVLEFLMAIEWEAVIQGDEACVWCHGFRDVAYYGPEGLPLLDNGHKVDCEWLRLYRFYTKRTYSKPEAML